MTNVIQYRDASDTTRGPSPSVWGTCPVLEIMAQVGQGSGGYYFWEDFDAHGLVTAPTALAALGGGLPFTGFGSSGSKQEVDDASGGSSGFLLEETTHEEGANFTTENHPYVLSNVAGSLWFEARVKSSTITTNEMSFFVGLADTTAFTAVMPLTAPGAVGDLNCIGFHKPEANTTAFDFSYKANGVTLEEVNSDIGTLAVDTYVKLGFLMHESDYKVRCFVNGAEQASTTTVSDALGTDTPSDGGLAPAGAIKNAGGTAEGLTIDWIRCAQLLPAGT